MLEPAGQWGQAPGRGCIPWSSEGAILAAGQTPRPVVYHSIGYSIRPFIIVAPAVDHSVIQLPHSLQHQAGEAGQLRTQPAPGCVAALGLRDVQVRDGGVGVNGIKDIADAPPGHAR